MKISLQRVRAMPKELSPGILYVSEQYGTAAHLCACGCGAKIRTPLSPTDWRLTDGKEGPSLCPSIGNWQRPCQSHYWIWNGEIEWANPWTEDAIIEGRSQEQAARLRFYEAKRGVRAGFATKLWRAVNDLFTRH